MVLYYLFVAVAYSESMAEDQNHGEYGYIVLWFLYRFVYVFGVGMATPTSFLGPFLSAVPSHARRVTSSTWSTWCACCIGC